MKKNTIYRISLVFCLLFMLTISVRAYTERDMLQKAVGSEEQLKQILMKNQSWIPYPAYNDRAGWDALLGEKYKTALIREGEKLLNYEWLLVRATDYLEFERTGNRYVMQDRLNKNRSAINSLMFAELAEGKGRFIDQLINGVYLSCEITSWVYSAHLSRQSNHRSLPDFREQVIDLSAGGYGAMLSWVYYYFHESFDKVNPSISIYLRQTLQERILDAYMNNDSEWWLAFNWKPGIVINNWNPWCNSNVLQCFLLLENDLDKLTKGVWRTMQSVDKFINFVKEDGACEEGPSYWQHAAGKLYDYLQILFDGTAGKVSLFQEPMIRRMGEYISRSYIGNGWVANFADASAKGGGDAQLIYRYGRAVGSDEMMHFAAYLMKGRRSSVQLGGDTFRSFQTLLFCNELEKTVASHDVPPCTWYPETEFCYLINKEGWFLAAKGGFNNESHNHNDVGSFSLYVNTTPILIDAGVGTYTRQTFGKERYTIWTMQSNYHNLPVINGIPQSYGQQYKATDVICRPGRRFFSANIAKAYPEEAAINRWIRSYSLGDRQLTVTDDFSLKSGKIPNQINFLTWGKVGISVPGKVSIEAQGQKVVIDYPRNLSVSLETIELKDIRLSRVWGGEIYRIVFKDKEIRTTGSYKFVIK